MNPTSEKMKEDSRDCFLLLITNLIVCRCRDMIRSFVDLFFRRRQDIQHIQRSSRFVCSVSMDE